MKKIYNKSLYLGELEVPFNYNKGEMLFYRETNSQIMEDEIWEIYGYLSKNDYDKKDEVLKELMSREDVDQLNVFIAPNVVKTKIDIDRKEVFHFAEIDLKIVEEVHEQYIYCRYKYKIDKNDMNIYVEVVGEEKCRFLGYSLEKEMPKEIKSMHQDRIHVLTYEEVYAGVNKMRLLGGHKLITLSDENLTEQEIRKLLRRKIDKYLYNDMLHYVKERVKGQQEVDRIVAGIYGYLNCVARGIPCDTNIMLTAPSGSGKTETYRAIRDYFKTHMNSIPVSQVDITTITPEGYKGKNINDVVVDLFAHPEKNGIGIVFIDEIDKRLFNVNKDVYVDFNEMVQSQLLTLIEGRDVTNSNNQKINTSNTMFIAMGSFDACRKKRVIEKNIGFGATIESLETDYYEDITRDDIQKNGCTYELLGRFTILANYTKLPLEIINSIIDKYVDEIKKMTGYYVCLSEEKREQLIKEANGKYGCRSIKNILYEEAMKKYAEVLKDNSRFIEIDI